MVIIEENTWNKVSLEEQHWLKVKPKIEEIIRELGLKTTIRIDNSRRTWTKGVSLIQFGTIHPSGRIYCEHKGKLVSWKPPFPFTKGYIHACTIIEEIAHAWNHAESGKDHHQAGFFRHFIKLWNMKSDELIKVCEEIWSSH